MSSEHNLIENVEEAAGSLARAIAEAELRYQLLTKEIDADFQKVVTAFRASSAAQIANARNQYAKTEQDIRAELRQIEKGAGILAMAWNDPAWSKFISAEKPPDVVRLGRLRTVNGVGVIETPALLPFKGGKNVIFKCAGAAKDRAAMAVQSIMLRLLTTCPPAKLRLLMIDPVGLGQNVAAFMHLSDYSKELITGQAWTEPLDIQKRLADLSSHMEMVIQKYLRNRYENIEDYNDKAGEVEEPYRLVTVVNFPTNFNDEAASRLATIASNGPRCGVYSLITIDMDQLKGRRISLADLERTGTVISWDGQRFIWEDQDFKEANLELDSPPPAPLFEALVHSVGVAAREAGGKIFLPFSKISLPEEQWWAEQADSSRGLSAPIGKAGAEGTLNYTVDQETAVHTLLAGIPGSGKSTLLHVLILSLSTIYSPEELELYLVDFKKGVEFQIYAPAEDGRGALPHARVIAVESEREFGISVLQALDAELTRRGNKFRGVASNLAEYRQKTRERLPRILLVVDEFHEFFSEDDTITQQSTLILDRLIKQGRSFGIHLLLATQSVKSTGSHSLLQSTRDLMAIRIALRCAQDDSMTLLGDNSASALLNRRGEAIYNSSVGRKEGNIRFQVAWLDDKETVIDKLCVLANHRSLQLAKPAYFEGNRPAQIGKNEQLVQKLDALSWPTKQRVVPAWIGSPVAIKDPTNARIYRQAGRNLLVLGRDESLAVGILLGCFASLVAAYSPDEVKFYICDALAAEMEWSQCSTVILNAFPHSIELITRRTLSETLAGVASIVDQRVENNATTDKAVFLIGLGMHRYRELQVGDPFASRQANAIQTPSASFGRIVRDGPEFGVHVLAWWDAYASLTRSVDRKNIPDFGIRVALPMAQDDSTHFIESQAAAKLAPNRAVLWDEERVGSLEKFVPYCPPTMAWLEKVGSELKSKAARE